MNQGNYHNLIMNKFILNHLIELKKKFIYPELELRVLLNKSSIKNKEIILSNFDKKDIDLIKFNNYFKRRLNNEPISKIVELKSFWKYDFYVNTNVLDPRPETELILENVLKIFPNKEKKLEILDMCTGSGCIAICLAKEYKNASILATDISFKAIEIAKKNAKNLKCLDQINFVHCDLINEINKFDIVICNPPYLSELEYNNTSLEIKNFEPKIALVGSNDGYNFYYRLAKILQKSLRKSSLALIEIGSSQCKKTIEIFKENKIVTKKIVKDINNLDRLLILNKP